MRTLCCAELGCALMSAQSRVASRVYKHRAYGVCPVVRGGTEPPTSGTSNRRSAKLSYRTMSIGRAVAAMADAVDVESLSLAHIAYAAAFTIVVRDGVECRYLWDD